MLTQEQYVQKGGLICPICQANDSTEGSSIEIDCNVAYQDCNCLECGANWTDVYILSGYDNLEQPAKEQSC